MVIILVEESFSANRMAGEYLKVYKKLASPQSLIPTMHNYAKETVNKQQLKDDSLKQKFVDNSSSLSL